MKKLKCIKYYSSEFIVGKEYKYLGIDDFDFGKRIINDNNQEIVINLDCVDEYFKEV